MPINNARLSHPTKTYKSRTAPWLLFVFLAAVFFFTYHDIATSKLIGDYNQSADKVIAEVAGGQLSRRIALLSLGVVAIYGLVRLPARRRLSPQGPLAGLLLALFTWAVLSPIWTADLSQGIKRLSGFVILCVAAVAVVRLLSLHEVILWTFCSTSTFLVIGIIAEFVNGTLRPFVSDYRFSGTLPPNNEGINCALMLLSALALADLQQTRRRFFWIVGAIAFCFLVLTGSRTGLVAAVFGGLIYVAAVRSTSTRVAMAIAVASLATCLGLAAAFGLVPNLGKMASMGRDDGGNVETFTGRTGIWQDVGPYIRKSPVVGYGYGGFWTPARIDAISEEEKWGVPNSHSAYVDYQLMLGIVGLVAFSGSLIVGIFYSFRAFSFSRRPAFAFCGVILVFCAIDAFFESDITEGSQLMFVVAIILIRLAFVPLQRIVRIGGKSNIAQRNPIALSSPRLEPL